MMQKLKFALGLAQKAGRLASGDLNIESALRNRKAKLLIIAQDAAESSKHNLYSLAEKYSIPVYEILTKVELGLAIGKSPRNSIAILDKNFVIMVEKYMEK